MVMLNHPRLDGVERDIPSGDVRSWERAGWVRVEPVKTKRGTKTSSK